MAGLLCGVPGSNDRLGLTATSAPLGPFPFPATPATPAAGMRHGDDTELSGPVRARGRQRARIPGNSSKRAGVPQKIKVSGNRRRRALNCTRRPHSYHWRGQLHCFVRLRLRSSFDREHSSPAYAPTPRKSATSPLGNHGAGSRCRRHTLYDRTTRTSEPDLRFGHVRRLLETPHSGPRGRSPWTRWLRLLRP